MEKGVEAFDEYILYKKSKPLGVCFDEDIIQPYLDALLGPLKDEKFRVSSEERRYILRALDRFVRVEEPSVTKQFSGDVSLLLAFIIDPPQRFVGYGRLMAEIYYLATEAAHVINRLGQGAKVERLNFILNLMSHRMDLIRMIYGEHPKASPVNYFDDYQAPIDVLVDYYLRHSDSELLLMESTVKRIQLLRAILMDPPEESMENDGNALEKLQFIAGEVCFTIASNHLNIMDQYMACHLSRRLKHICQSPCLRQTIEHKVERIYTRRPKPSRIYYPKMGQLDFVDLLVGNLGELLVKAQADASIHVLKFDILLLQRKLQEVSRHLIEIAESRKEEADIKDVITNIANLAYEAEYVTDSFLVGNIPIWCSVLWFRDILKELEHQRELFKMQFSDANSIISNILNMDSGKLEIIPIFNDNTEIGNTLNQVFVQMCGWDDVCTTSLVSSYKERKKEVLLDLLHNASFGRHSKSDEIDYTSDMSEAELEELLYNLLEDKNYFIILECVQDVYALYDIKRILPNDLHHRKTVLLTTPSSKLVV